MRLSIVTPTLNAERWLAECLDSVRANGTPGVTVRHLVVDCGSTDATVDLAVNAGADVMRVPRRGLFYQINVGYRNADADAIGYLGGDDTLLPGAIDAIARWYRRPERAEWLVGVIRWTDAIGRPIGDVKPPPSLTPQALASLGWSCVPHQATVVTPRLFDELGGFDESFRHVGDHDFFIRALGRYPLYDRTPAALATFRRHGANVSMAGDERRYREMTRIVREHAPRSALRRNAARFALKLRLNASSPAWFIGKKARAVARRLTPRARPAVSPPS